MLSAITSLVVLDPISLAKAATVVDLRILSMIVDIGLRWRSLV